MSLICNGSNGVLLNVPLATGTPVFMTAWVKPNSTSSSGNIMGLSNATSNSGWTLHQENNVNVATARSPGGGAKFGSISPLTTGWQLIGGWFNSSTFRQAILGGDVSTNGSTASALPIVDRTSIGSIFDGSGTVGVGFVGKIAHVAFWNASQTNNLADLASGLSPDHYTTGLLSYLTLASGKTDSNSTNSWTDFGSPTYDAEDNPEITPVGGSTEITGATISANGQLVTISHNGTEVGTSSALISGLQTCTATTGVATIGTGVGTLTILSPSDTENAGTILNGLAGTLTLPAGFIDGQTEAFTYSLTNSTAIPSLTVSGTAGHGGGVYLYSDGNGDFATAGDNLLVNSSSISFTEGTFTGGRALAIGEIGTATIYHGATIIGNSTFAVTAMPMTIDGDTNGIKGREIVISGSVPLSDGTAGSVAFTATGGTFDETSPLVTNASTFTLHFTPNILGTQIDIVVDGSANGWAADTLTITVAGAPATPTGLSGTANGYTSIICNASGTPGNTMLYGELAFGTPNVGALPGGTVTIGEDGWAMGTVTGWQAGAENTVAALQFDAYGNYSDRDDIAVVTWINFDTFTSITFSADGADLLATIADADEATVRGRKVGAEDWVNGVAGVITFTDGATDYGTYEFEWLEDEVVVAYGTARWRPASKESYYYYV